LARRVVGQRLLRWIEALVERIPLANIIYSSARKLLDILQTKPDGTQRVVLIDFPHDQMKSVGFVTRVIREHGTGRELAAVYVPTTPNPTSGYLEIVPVEKITPTDWTVDQAMSFIISGGAVAPDTIPFAPPARDPAWARDRPQRSCGAPRAAACTAGASSVHDAQGHPIGPWRPEERIPRARLDRSVEADLAVGLVGEVAAPQLR